MEGTLEREKGEKKVKRELSVRRTHTRWRRKGGC